MSGEDVIELCKPEIVMLLLKDGAAVSENDVKLAQENKRLKDTAVSGMIWARGVVGRTVLVEELRKNLKKWPPRHRS